MKRFLILFIILFHIFLFSCSTEIGDRAYLKEGLSAVKGKAVINGESYGITLCSDGDANLRLTIDSPEGLKGYSFTVSSDRVRVYYEDKSAELSCLPRQIPLLNCIDILRLREAEYISTDVEGDLITDRFHLKEAEITVYTKKKSSYPHLMEYSRDGVSIAFEIEGITE